MKKLILISLFIASLLFSGCFGSYDTNSENPDGPSAVGPNGPPQQNGPRGGV